MMLSSQQTGDIEFCCMAFISTSNLALAVQVSPCSTRGILIYEMVPLDFNMESETFLRSGHSGFNDEVHIASSE